MTETGQFHTSTTTIFNHAGMQIEERTIEPGMWVDDTVKTYRNKTTFFRYDDAGKLIETSKLEWVGDSSMNDLKPKERWTRMYDSAGRMTLERHFTRFSEEEEEYDKTLYSYDSLGQLVRLIQIDLSNHLPSQTDTTVYHYIITPDSARTGWTVTTERCETDSIRQQKEGNMDRTISADARGVIRHVVMGAQGLVFQEARYDSSGNVTYAQMLDDQHGCMASIDYLYDNHGNLDERREYCYSNYRDALAKRNRKEIERVSYAYELDAHGNWTRQEGISYDNGQPIVPGNITERRFTYFNE
jgi:hypothetical protein